MMLMNKEEELGELEDLEFRLSWYKLGLLNLKHLEPLRTEVQKRIAELQKK